MFPEFFHLGLELFGEPVTDDIDGRGIEVQRCRHPQHRPLLPHVEIEHLKMPRLDPARDAVDCGGQHVLLPLAIPLILVVDRRGHALDGVGRRAIAALPGPDLLGAVRPQRGSVSLFPTDDGRDRRLRSGEWHRHGGTYAHQDIAFEFASWISVEFKLYLIKEFQRLKEDENRRLSLAWNLNRTLARRNYRIHTDAIKAHLIPPEVTPAQAAISYATEANRQVPKGTRRLHRPKNRGLKT